MLIDGESNVIQIKCESNVNCIMWIECESNVIQIECEQFNTEYEQIWEEKIGQSMAS